jgi:hypothetical protein
MISFPKSTEYGRRIPKEKFYSRLGMNGTMKSYIVEDIDQIVWRNKLSPSILNVAAGASVIEIDVLEINLKKKDCHYGIFEFIDKNLPNHTVFILTFSDEAQLFINYKEAIESRAGKHKIIAAYKTDWLSRSEVQLSIDGLNLDQVYESFVAQIAGEKLAIDDHPGIKRAIVSANESERLRQEIAALELKVLNETQFNIQVRLSTKLKILKKRLDKNENSTFE